MFCVGFSYTQLSVDLDATLGNLLNILLISSIEDLVVAILLPVPTTKLMEHVKLGNKQFHFVYEEGGPEAEDGGSRDEADGGSMEVEDAGPQAEGSGEGSQGTVEGAGEQGQAEGSAGDEGGPAPAEQPGAEPSGAAEEPPAEEAEEIALEEEQVMKKGERAFQTRRFLCKLFVGIVHFFRDECPLDLVVAGILCVILSSASLETDSYVPRWHRVYIAYAVGISKWTQRQSLLSDCKRFGICFGRDMLLRLIFSVNVAREDQDQDRKQSGGC